MNTRRKFVAFGATTVAVSALVVGLAAAAPTVTAPDSPAVTHEVTPKQGQTPAKQETPAAESRKQPGMSKDQREALAAAKEAAEQYDAASRPFLVFVLREHWEVDRKLAPWAVDELRLDWNAQAVRAAESSVRDAEQNGPELLYSMSHGQYPFTAEQALHAVEAVGLDPKPTDPNAPGYGYRMDRGDIKVFPKFSLSADPDDEPWRLDCWPWEDRAGYSAIYAECRDRQAELRNENESDQADREAEEPAPVVEPEAPAVDVPGDAIGYL